MKLRNKKTGEIIEFDAILPVRDVLGDSVAHLEYNSLAELNEEWEDYEEPKEFWYISDFGYVFNHTINKKSVKSTIEEMKSIGNYFKSREEAEKAVEKLKAWKRLKDKGFMITLQDCKGSAWLQANWGNLQGDYSDVLLLFGGEE